MDRSHIYRRFSRRTILLAVCLCLAVIRAFPQSMPAHKFDALLSMIKYAYVDTVNESELTDDVIRGILRDLDPHSTYIPADELKKANEPLVGNFEGIGIQFNILMDTIFVTNTIPGGPSEKVGLQAGDRIVHIDGANAAGIKITNDDVIRKLRGPKGTKVTVGILRRGVSDILDFAITRDKIPLVSIDASYIAEPGIGYIKLNKFADATVDEFRQALDTLKEQGITGLILDLTRNGGGYLNRAIEIADEFLGEGKRIVYTEGEHSPKQEYFATDMGGWEQGLLVVLIDEYSASASEIVSGAVQDWDRGLIIGRRSFAKGLVQKPFPLPDGSAVRLTVARYYTPSGRCIQKPYEAGDEDSYALEVYNRQKAGELFSVDSIHLTDSLRYFTHSRRTVYGGGGIMPDVFVPFDTSLFSDFYLDLQRKGILNEFALSYVDKHRKKMLADYGNAAAYKAGFRTDSLFMKEFFDYAALKEVKKDEVGYARCKKLLETQLKALIARDLWTSTAYYEVINDINDTYLKALECFKDNTFDKMKIAGK